MTKFHKHCLDNQSLIGGHYMQSQYIGNNNLLGVEVNENFDGMPIV